MFYLPYVQPITLATCMIISWCAYSQEHTSDISILNKKEYIHLCRLPSSASTIRLLEEQEHHQFVVCLPHATVVNEGGIITQEGFILEDTQTTYSDQHGLRNEQWNIHEENPLFFHGTLAVISSAGSENWYHWLLQILPRLIILEKSCVPYDRIYVNNVLYSWQLSSLHRVLSYLHIPVEKLLIINGNCVIQAQSLVVPSVPFMQTKWIPLFRWFTKELRNIFLTHDHDTGKIFPKKIYISRGQAAVRRIINETALIAALEQQNFQTVYLETLSAPEQAELFYHADVIVGPHGSGFANLIFIRPSCTIVEIDHGMHPPRSPYSTLTQQMQAVYHPFYVDMITPEHENDDMIVDIPAFLEYLATII